MLQKKSKSGMVSTEVAIGVTLMVVLLFVVLGLFSDNLSDMIASTNLKNIFSSNDSKTGFSFFNRDYSNSQINVQIMGEQGLEMLRKKANNMAIELIEVSFNKSNPNADSIAYLSTAIKGITGEPHLCLPMKKDSNKRCNEDDIGGYNYNLALGSAALTIKKVNPAGNVVSESLILTIDNSVSNILNSSNINTDSNMNEKYEFIKKLSENVESYVNDNVLLVRVSDTLETADQNYLTDTSNLIKGDLAALYNLGIKNFVYKDASNSELYSTNGIFGSTNKDSNIATNYLTSGEGKTTTLNGFTEFLANVKSAASSNIHNSLDRSLGSSFIDNALEYAYQATYNKFVYNSHDNYAIGGVHDLSSSAVSFYNNGEKDIVNEKTSGKDQICFNYSFTSGPGNHKYGDSRDWVVSVVSYVDTKQVVSTYLNYFKQYCNQHK